MFKILLLSTLLQAAPTLVQTLDELYAQPEGKHLDSTCDEKYQELKYKIARDLDQRTAEIMQAQQSNQGKKPAVAISQVKQLPDGWQSFVRRWSHFYADYYATLEKPTSDPMWLSLLETYRAMLADEQDRILSWKNPDLGHDMGPLIEQLIVMMKDCVAGGDCSDARLTEDEQYRVNMMDFYGFYTRKVFHGPEERKRPVAEEFLKRLAVDADYFLAKNMGHQVDPKTQTIYIKMLAPEFAQKTSKLEQLFSGVWSTMGIKVEIEWLSRAAENMFEILLGDFGGRPFVAVDKRQMIMPPSTTSQDFSHEFGHVLGLPDQYYTRWNKFECEYIYEYDNSNIMSNHRAGGVVQKHHIEALQKVYFGL